MITMITINDISCYGYHGVLAQERQLGQEFRVSLVLTADLPPEACDRLEDTVDYRAAVAITHRIIQGEPRRLLETLALAIARELLFLPRVSAVRVRVCKPHPPISGVHGGVAVEISLPQEG
jgi:7,8-dihydroneopterin aldolase/epimerase/oxygenase